MLHSWVEWVISIINFLSRMDRCNMLCKFSIRHHIILIFINDLVEQTDLCSSHWVPHDFHGIEELFLLYVVIISTIDHLEAVEDATAIICDVFFHDAGHFAEDLQARLVFLSFIGDGSHLCRASFILYFH